MTRPRVHYAWVIAAITFLVLIVTSGVRADTWRADGAARDRVRLEPHRHLGGDRDQHRPLRPHRPVRRLAHGPLRASPHRPRGHRAPVALGGAHHADADAVAADTALGRPGGQRHGRDGARPGRRDREPLVRRTPRPRAWHPVGRQRHRTAGVPAAARRPGGDARLANGRSGGVWRRGAGLRRRLAPDARPSLRRGPRAVRPPARCDGAAARPAGSGRRPAVRARQAGVLAAGGVVLHLRREHERPHRHAPHRRLPRLRHLRGARGRVCWP